MHLSSSSCVASPIRCNLQPAHPLLPNQQPVAGQQKSRLASVSDPADPPSSLLQSIRQPIFEDAVQPEPIEERVSEMAQADVTDDWERDFIQLLTSHLPPASQPASIAQQEANVSQVSVPTLKSIFMRFPGV